MFESWFPSTIFYEDLQPPRKVKQGMLKYVDNFYNTHKGDLKEKDNLTGDVYDDYTIHRRPEFEWLNRSVSRHCKQYLEGIGADMSEVTIYAQKSWPVVCKKNGGCVREHTHGNSMVSAVYYLKTQVNGTGNLIFYNSSKLFPIPFDTSQSGCMYEPIEDRLILFPSDLKHSVDQYRGTENRYSISYDITLVSNPNSGSVEKMVIDPSLWSDI
tara:strand:+ start:27 stop:665 length:639 start_codon:yes stop_codon:yes gene_type:complete